MKELSLAALTSMSHAGEDDVHHGSFLFVNLTETRLAQTALWRKAEAIEVSTSIEDFLKHLAASFFKDLGENLLSKGMPIAYRGPTEIFVLMTAYCGDCNELRK